jgi:hypothetical protein
MFCWIVAWLDGKRLKPARRNQSDGKPTVFLDDVDREGEDRHEPQKPHQTASSSNALLDMSTLTLQLVPGSSPESTP